MGNVQESVNEHLVLPVAEPLPLPACCPHQNARVSTADEGGWSWCWFRAAVIAIGDRALQTVLKFADVRGRLPQVLQYIFARIEHCAPNSAEGYGTPHVSVALKGAYRFVEQVGQLIRCHEQREIKC